MGREDGAAEQVRMSTLITALFPLCRSITGEGLRRSLDLIARHVPLTLREVPSGTRIFDWTIPKEWNVRGAFIATLAGRRIVDFGDCNLHLVQYSPPLDRVVAREELLAHIHTLPERPGWIPYRTSYYEENWGFCLSERQALTLTEPAYRVVIDTTLAPGHLSYGELAIAGENAQEMLISCHCCHPSLANDNLSGMAVATMLARRLLAAKRRMSYRFLFIPGTIGSLAWLAANEARVANVRWGLVLSCLGDRGGFTYKQSRRGAAEIDRILAHVLRHSGAPHRIEPFVPYGYDERQYCSPGFDMPVGCFMRSPNGGYPEYHSSADDLTLIAPECLAQSLALLWQAVAVIEGNETYLSRNPKGEPQLGRRGLYRPMGGYRETSAEFDGLALLWVLNQADAEHSLLDIAERAGLPFAALRAAADALLAADLIAPTLG
jgi:aminopeptidase-like protein